MPPEDWVPDDLSGEEEPPKFVDIVPEGCMLLAGVIAVIFLDPNGQRLMAYHFSGAGPEGEPRTTFYGLLDELRFKIHDEYSGGEHNR